MVEIIPPLTPPNLPPQSGEGAIGGTIENLPPQLAPILKPTESLLLKVLMNSTTMTNQGPVTSLETSLAVRLDGKNIELPLKIAVEGKLNLPLDRDNEVVIKLSNFEKGSFKLISINNESPAKYLTSTSRPISAPVLETQSAAPLVIEAGKALQNVKLHPLEVAPLLENVAHKGGLPQEVISTLQTAFKEAQINFKVDNLLPPQATPAAPGDKLVQNILPKIQELLTNLNEVAKTANPQKSVEIFNQLKAQLQLLSGQVLSGETISRPDNQLVAIKTLLGNILPEVPLKIANGTPLEMVIANLKLPGLENVFKDLSLSNLLPSRQLIENLSNLSAILNVATPLSPSSHNSPLTELLKLLQPLEVKDNPDLTAKIMAKLPSLNSQMLPNLVGFVKGAMNHNLADWLGKEIVEELKTSGREGQEAATRLTGLLTSGNREGLSWRLVEVPFMNGDSLSKIRIAVKKFDEEEEESARLKKSKFGTRFVVDTSFSQLGDFQLDGFSVVGERRFDLVIRSSKEVSDDLYANIMRIFKTTLHEVEYVGNFKLNVKENFIKVCEDENNETLKTGIYI